MYTSDSLPTLAVFSFKEGIMRPVVDLSRVVQTALASGKDEEEIRRMITQGAMGKNYRITSVCFIESWLGYPYAVRITNGTEERTIHVCPNNSKSRA